MSVRRGERLRDEFLMCMYESMRYVAPHAEQMYSVGCSAASLEIYRFAWVASSVDAVRSIPPIWSSGM